MQADSDGVRRYQRVGGGLNLRAGDALHLAVAADHGVRIGALDRTLVSAAEALGVSAALVEV